MKIVFFTHPEFLAHQSMPRYAKWLAEGMKARGHQIELWSARARFSALPVKSASLKKWLGYADQYILFPVQVRARLKKLPADTLFVFTDHALGPWVPLVKNRLHVIHCHDFLAQRSALGEIPENVTGRTGKIYQSYIRKGYKSGRNFISISYKTKADLHAMLDKPPGLSEVVYNGLTRKFIPSEDISSLRAELSRNTGIDLSEGFILHIGGNLWYKNKRGIISGYNRWRQQSTKRLPLLLIGEAPDEDLRKQIEASEFSRDIYPLSGIGDDFANKAYCAASVFLFPSLAEGFGLPIIEAMASGSPVITTDEAPMNEVGGNAAFYISKMQPGEEQQWNQECASAIDRILNFTEQERAALISSGFDNVRRFDSETALDKMEEIYQRAALFMREPELHE